MKKKYLTVIGWVCLSLSVHAGNFRISGTAEIEAGEMVLCVERVGGQDTIARAPLVEGRFEMEGTIEQPEVAVIGVNGYSGGFVFLLDDEKPYEMDLRKDGFRIEGGKLQSVYADYMEMVGEMNGEIQALKQEKAEAEEARHFRTVSELDAKIKKLQAESQKKLDAVLDKHRGTLFSTYVMSQLAMTSGNVAYMQQVYDGLPKESKEMEPAKLLLKRIADLTSLQIGQVAPDFVLPDTAGNEVRLSDIQGKIKLIDFWASWCGPCRMENPNMVSLYRDFKDKGLAIVSVSLDTKKAAWLRAIAEDGLPWTHVSSLKGAACEVVKRYEVVEVPFIWVLDGNNRILAKQLRGKELRAFVENYLNNNQ